MILNWEMKPYLRATNHSHGPSVHPGYPFGTEETNVHIATVTVAWPVVVVVGVVVCVGPLSPCNS